MKVFNYLFGLANPNCDITYYIKQFIMKYYFNYKENIVQILYPI